MDVAIIILLIMAMVIVIIFTVFVLLVLSGFGHDPVVDYGDPGLSECTIAYKYVEGSYSGWMVGSTFTEVTSICPKAQTIGIFYDDPNVVSEYDLRSIVGCVLSPECESKEDMEMLERNGFKLFKLPIVDSAVVATFPYTTPFSLWLAPRRVYPNMHHFVQSRSLCAYPMIELYGSDVVKYAAPLSKQDDFFVPESIRNEQNEDSQSSASTIESSILTQSSVNSNNSDGEDTSTVLDDASIDVSQAEIQCEPVIQAQARKLSQASSSEDSFEQIDNKDLDDKKNL